MNIYHQSVFNTWPLEDKSIQAIITSPPYWGLRKYDIPDIKIGDWIGQYGLEENYLDYIEHTRLWVREAWRILKDDGIFFLNIGDGFGGIYNSANAKCKMLIPHRIAIALIEDGWILRNDLIWAKGNPMPESVKDRFSKGYEYIFMFVKQPKYYFDLDTVREKPISKNNLINRNAGSSNGGYIGDRFSKGIRLSSHLKGKNPSDIWTINTQPSGELHFAMWPEKLVDRMISCSTKPGDSILDPFAGSGTTLLVAEKLNRVGYGIDLGYEDIQARRLNNIQKLLL